jgi:Methyltransferase domain
MSDRPPTARSAATTGSGPRAAGRPRPAPRRRLPVHRPRPLPTAPVPAPGEDGRARDRFRDLDGYRVSREWKRYEGTPQRDLFRELRGRFLERHRGVGRWALDVGPGPGRFTPWIGGPGTRRVLLDLSQEMLKEASRRVAHLAPGEPSVDLVRGDGAHPPFRDRQFAEVVLMGNVVGFAEGEAVPLLRASLALVDAGGTIAVETVAGPGERSRYLARLPPGAVRRLLAAPVNLVRPRVEREGFRAEPADRTASTFRRMPETEVREAFRAAGVEPTEALAVAPALGSEPDRVAAVRTEAAAWRRLLELEEVLGRTAGRRERAAALLVAGVRPLDPPSPGRERTEPKRAIK